MNSHLTVAGKWYAFQDRGMVIIHAQAQAPYSYAFCCPRCGEIWARYGVEHTDSQWSFLRRECERHAYGLTVPGSVWISYEPEFTSAFPPELLARELELHINFFLKWEPQQ